MTPRDRLQRLLFEHRTAHDPASSEREILAMFEEAQKPREQMVDADNGVPSEMDNGEVRGASRLAGEASSAEGATSTVVLGAGEAE